MRWLLWLPLFCSLVFAQGGVIGPKGVFGPNGVVSPGASGGGSSVTVNVGQTIASQAVTDTGFGLFVSATQFTTPTPSSGGITVSSEGVFVGTPGAGNWGVAIYNDSANAPSTLVTNCNTFSSSTATSPAATLVPSSCTLSSATKYWVAWITVSNTQTVPLSSKGNCDSSGRQSVISNGTIASFTSTASWPGSFPANTAAAECLGIFASIQYSTTATYTIAGSGVGVCGASVTSCTVDVAPLGTGHGLVVGNVGVDLSAVAILVSSFADSASDTITRLGTCTGTTTISDAICIGSADRATAGANTLTANYGGTALSGAIGYAEIIGTAASSSFDQVEYDTVRLATPFTSGSTPTTTQAAEILFGIADNTNATGTFTAGGSWSLLGQATTATGNNVTVGWFTQTVAATNTYNLQGTYSVGATTNLPGLATFK